MLCLKVSILRTVQEKSHKIRYNGFAAFLFQKFDNIVISGRMEFDKYLTDNADTRFGYVKKRKIIKFIYYLFNNFIEFADRQMRVINTLRS